MKATKEFRASVTVKITPKDFYEQEDSFQLFHEKARGGEEGTLWTSTDYRGIVMHLMEIPPTKDDSSVIEYVL